MKKISSFDVLKDNKNITIITLLSTSVFCEKCLMRMFLLKRRTFYDYK